MIPSQTEHEIIVFENLMKQFVEIMSDFILSQQKTQKKAGVKIAIINRVVASDYESCIVEPQIITSIRLSKFAPHKTVLMVQSGKLRELGKVS